jgi:hypothetical protein
MIKNKLSRKKIRDKRNKTKRIKNIKSGGGGLCSMPIKTSNFLKNNYSIKNIYSGSTWYIYSNATNQNILIKKIGPVKWLTLDEIEKEFKIAQKASDLGVGPLVHYWCIDHTKDGVVGYLVMDKINGINLGELLNSSNAKKDDVMKKIQGLLDILYDNGIEHNDRFPVNFMYGNTQTEPNARLWIIDYGNVNEYNGPVSLEKRRYFLFE